MIDIMGQENDKKWRKLMHIIVNAMIWIAVLAAVGCLFLFFRHDNTAEELQGNSVELVERTVDSENEAMQNDTAWTGNADENIHDDGIPEDTADTDAYNYTGYMDISLQMDNGAVSQNIKMYMKGDKCYFFLPTCASSCRFTIQYQQDRYEINIDDKPVASGDQIAYGDFAKQHTLTIAAQGDFVPYSLEFMQSENLPVVFIETANGTMEYVNQSKTNKEAGEMICILPDGSVDSTGTFSIHARGSASFESTEKKQYKMTLEEAADILSMGKGCG